jgi:hypothetical protein
MVLVVPRQLLSPLLKVVRLVAAEGQAVAVVELLAQVLVAPAVLDSRQALVVRQQHMVLVEPAVLAILRLQPMEQPTLETVGAVPVQTAAVRQLVPTEVLVALLFDTRHKPLPLHMTTTVRLVETLPRSLPTCQAAQL